MLAPPQQTQLELPDASLKVARRGIARTRRQQCVRGDGRSWHTMA